MSGNVSYAFTHLSNLPLHAAVFCAKKKQNKTKQKTGMISILQTFPNFSFKMNRLNPKLFFLKLGH